jgi:putative oxidoreductase
MFKKLLATSSSWVPVPLRIGLGAVFVGHGAQKVLGSFGGPGFNRFIEGQTPFPFMRPAWLWLSAAALGELVGAVLILLGLFTRVGAFFIACIMLTAVIGIHWPVFFLPRGIEYALTLLMVAVALLISGGGAASIDGALGGSRGRR